MEGARPTSLRHNVVRPVKAHYVHYTCRMVAITIAERCAQLMDAQCQNAALEQEAALPWPELPDLELPCQEAFPDVPLARLELPSESEYGSWASIFDLDENASMSPSRPTLRSKFDKWDHKPIGRSPSLDSGVDECLPDFVGGRPAKRARTVSSRDTSPTPSSCGSMDADTVTVLGEELHSAEYHFRELQRHSELAVAALQRGHYTHGRAIVTWAHDLKNKVVHEVAQILSQGTLLPRWCRT